LKPVKSIVWGKARVIGILDSSRDRRQGIRAAHMALICSAQA